uniref:Myb-like domain-containing protein n=1 Tax=Eptatretus burgeri TaxID=7764 RepID=A0A8C4QDD8_EPTBU
MGKSKDNRRGKKSRRHKDRDRSGDDDEREALELNERESQFLHIKDTKMKRNKSGKTKRARARLTCQDIGETAADYFAGAAVPCAAPQGHFSGSASPQGSHDGQVEASTNPDVLRGASTQYCFMDCLAFCDPDRPQEDKMRLLEEMIPHFSNMSRVQVEKALKYDVERLLLMKSKGQDLLRLHDQLLHRATIMYEGIDLKSGSLTASEKKRLLDLQQQYGNNWRQIGEVMQRGSKNLAVLHKNVLFASKKGIWSVEETHQLINAMKAYILQPQEEGGYEEKMHTLPTLPFRELCPPNVPWTNIAFIVQTRNNDQCRHKWVEIVSWLLGRIAPAEQRWHFPASSIRLITVLHNQGVDDEAHVKWEAVSHEMCDIPVRFLQRQFFKLKELHVPLWRHKSFGELADYLNNHVLPRLQKRQEKLNLKNRNPAHVSPNQVDIPVQTLWCLLNKLFSILEASVKEPEAEEEAVTSLSAK